MSIPLCKAISGPIHVDEIWCIVDKEAGCQYVIRPNYVYTSRDRAIQDITPTTDPISVPMRLDIALKFIRE